MSEASFCRLWVNTTLEHSDVVRTLAEVVGGTTLANMVSSQHMEMTVDRNDWFDDLRTGEPNGWLYYPFTVEVDPANGVDVDVYLGSIRQLVEACRDRGVEVYPVCEPLDERVRE